MILFEEKSGLGYSNEILTLREKCPDTELFLVRIQEKTDQK